MESAVELRQKIGASSSGVLYRDFELVELRNRFKECFDILKVISNRFESRKTDELSYSLEKAKHARIAHQIESSTYYNFTFGSHVVALHRFRGFYSLYTSDIDFSYKLAPLVESKSGVGHFFGQFKEFEDAQKAFCLFVACYVAHLSGDFEINPKGLPF